MSDLFLPLVTPPGALNEPAHWFLFQGAQLLVHRAEGRAWVPLVAHPRELGLEPLRTQYLGTLSRQHCYSAECAAGTPAPDSYAWSGLRALFGLFDDVGFALAGRALQIMDWDRSHQYCGRCGTPTSPKSGERARECPNCGQVHYPRIAPAVMALVQRRDQLLLARSPHFVPGMHSALAGFVEPGESLEQCLVREVKEEVGVEVANLRYFSSQSWPFPHSLMIAFNCDWAAGEISPDPSEIEAAGWFSLENLPVLPNKISVARRLIDATIARIRAGIPVS
ncbi:MAG TPA: NAD(+) diphosphatase [Burkholderiales bacterium]|nr:NAD(+) diphosphatase [Burkholderiales bacterium]